MTQTNGVTQHVGIPRRTIGVVAALLVCAGTVLGGCASSGPPKSRTVLFVRPDLNFTVVWDAAVETLQTEFQIAEESINTRTILTDYRYDDREPAKIRWRVRATVIELEGNWGNKGDVEVLFDNPDETIRIEVRYYTRADCQAEADETFSKMFLWAATTSSQTIFKDLDPEDSCIPLKEEVVAQQPQLVQLETAATERCCQSS